MKTRSVVSIETAPEGNLMAPGVRNTLRVCLVLTTHVYLGYSRTKIENVVAMARSRPNAKQARWRKEGG